MGFTSLLRTSHPRLQVNCLKVHIGRHNLRPPCYQNARLFSSVIQRSGHTPRNTVFRVTPSSRNYWWSSSTTAPSTSASSPATVSRGESTPPAPSGQPPAESAVSVEPSPIPTVPGESTSTHHNIVAEQVDLPTSSLNAVIPDSPLSTIPDILPAPLQYGDFSALGLSGWMPPGIIAWSFETLQVTTGMPWFYAIVAGTVLWRLSVVMPSIRAAQGSAIMRTSPDIAKAKANFEAIKAKGTKNQMTMAAQKLQKAYKDAGVSIVGVTLMSLVQLPVMIGLFLAVKRMCSLPVEQLKHSGVSFLPDLTLVPGTEAFDPYYILPIISVIAINQQLKVGLKDVDPNTPSAAHVMNCFRMATPLMLAFSSYFPAGLLLSILTGTVCSIAQALMLRIPLIRRKLGLRRLPTNTLPPPSLLDTSKFVIKSVRDVYTSSSSSPKSSISASSSKLSASALSSSKSSKPLAAKVRSKAS